MRPCGVVSVEEKGIDRMKFACLESGGISSMGGPMRLRTTWYLKRCLLPGDWLLYTLRQYYFK